MSDPVIDRLDVSAYSVPLSEPEADGTLTWDKVTIVVAEPQAGGVKGLGFTHGAPACAAFIRDKLEHVVVGTDPMDVPGAWAAMVRAIRGEGRPGVSSMAIAAVDTALRDLMTRFLDLPLCGRSAMVCMAVPIWRSGGVSSFTKGSLPRQLSTL